MLVYTTGNYRYLEYFYIYNALFIYQQSVFYIYLNETILQYVCSIQILSTSSIIVVVMDGHSR